MNEFQDKLNQMHDRIITLTMCPGMTLRDWFAGQALAGMTVVYLAKGEPTQRKPEGAAKETYEWADAMLKAREEQPEGTTSDAAEILRQHMGLRSEGNDG